MEKRIIQLLEEQNKKSDSTDRKIDQVIKEYDERFSENDNRWSEQDKKLAAHDKQFKAIFIKLLDHDQQLEDIRENMATRQELNKVINTLDKFVGLYVKTDQEQVFMGQRVARVESDVEKIKIAVKLA